MKMFEKEGNALVYRWDGEMLRIEPWGKNSLRVRGTMQGQLTEQDFALLEPEPCLDAEVFAGSDYAEIKNGNIQASAAIEPFSRKVILRFYNGQGETLLQELSPGGSLKRNARDYQALLGGDYKLRVSFQASEGEKLYGMGQYQQDVFDLKGSVLELAHRNSQASVPFVLSNKGYGFLWHNPAIGQVIFGQNETQWTAESTKQTDYWITAGDTPDQIMQAYGKATGTVPMMPEYGMGFWQCKLRYWNQEELLETARTYVKKQIPVDVIVCDFFHWPKMGDYRFEEALFPDPAAMTEELRSYGMELMVSVWPQVDLQSENFIEMKQKGLLVKSERGVEVAMRFGGESRFYDTTNPEARAYVWEKCRTNYYDKGIRLFWLDEAEPEYNVYDFDNYRYHAGPNLQVGNVYPQQFIKGFHDGLKQEGEMQPLNLIRCAWAGSQRYGALVWSGDVSSSWEAFRNQLCAGLHMGIAGIPWWTTDIGGFSGGDPADEEFRELLVRWFQWGTFCPVMRLHGDRKGGYVPEKADGTKLLFTGGANEVWSFGPENEKILTHYIRMREAMRPYTRRLMKEAHENGRPVMRPMFYEFPDDLACWNLKEQYMYGDQILVAPILYKGSKERSVYLPEGAKWISMLSGETYAGGQEVQVPAEIDQIPVFFKSKVLEELKVFFT